MQKSARFIAALATSSNQNILQAGNVLKKIVTLFWIVAWVQSCDLITGDSSEDIPVEPPFSGMSNIQG